MSFFQKLLSHSILSPKKALLVLSCIAYAVLIPSLFSAPELVLPGKPESSKLFVLDASGSMNEYLGIYQKIHLAKKYVRHFVDSLPEETEVGFIGYGNRLPGCQSSRLYQPLEKGNKDQFRNKLFGLTPSGATPLAESIRIAGDYIIRRKSTTELILVTDGAESCYGDPEKELRNLQRKGVDFKMHILGLGLKPEEKQIMQSLAKTGGGKYYNVDGDSDFYAAVEDLLKSDSPAKKIDTQNSKIQSERNGKIRITRIEKKSSSSETDFYSVYFEFENLESNNQCVILNLKRPETSLSFFRDWNPLRSVHPENTIRTDQTCYPSQKGEGLFLLDLPSKVPLKLELELWDMQDIPTAVDKSGERSVP